MQTISNEYRMMPLWVWNSNMSFDEIEHSLMELKNHGFGGAFVHPRPGMIISYMDEAWFEAWNHALKIAKSLDLILNIYDENSYPSGFGGGLISSQLPDCWAESISIVVVENRKEQWLQKDETIVEIYSCEKQDHLLQIKEVLTDIEPCDWSDKGSHICYVKYIPPIATGWLAGFPNVDMLRPEVTKLFLEKIYTPYYEQLGDEFGKTIKAIFTDEPSVIGSRVNEGECQFELPMSPWFSHEFQKCKGYAILDYIPALFLDCEPWDYYKIRYDYYDVMQQL